MLRKIFNFARNVGASLSLRGAKQQSKRESKIHFLYCHAVLQLLAMTN
ncbi:hypothetical protein [Helicobacter fennelliae]|nr:hypothetical protein [Helicobacter fennelliae]